MQNNSFSKNLIRGLRKRISKWTHNPYKAVNLNQVSLVYYKHLRPGVIRSHILFGKPFLFSSATEFVAGLKEIFIDEIYKQKLPDHPYIIDCGANIGLSVIYMKRLYPNAEILAFEPDERNYSLLEKNVSERELKNVDLKREAVWVENSHIYFSQRGSTDSKISMTNESGIKIKCIRLKDLLTRSVNFLKIDIEGAEHRVMLDIQDDLSKVQNLFIEYHGMFNENAGLTEILNVVTKAGFSYYLKEALSIFKTPFFRTKDPAIHYDVQLNIFCFRIEEKSHA